MKQLSFWIAALLLNTAALAQPRAFDAFIEKYRNDKAFTYAFLSKDLFEVVSRQNVSDKDWRKAQQVVGGIGSLCVLAADDISNGPALYREAKALVPESDFDELLAVRDGKDNVRIWARSEDSRVTDLVLLAGTPDAFVLVCFAGSLELNNLTELARLFDAEGAAQLARTAEAVSADFQVSPNPNNGQFTLSFPDAQDAPAHLSVLDQNGRLLADRTLTETAVQSVTLGDLPSGLYWLQLKTRQGKIGIKQVLVKR